MSKTLTLRMDEETYQVFRAAAQADRRSIANLILSSALDRIRDQQFVDDYEMAEIQSNEELMKRLRKGSRDARQGRGRFVD